MMASIHRYTSLDGEAPDGEVVPGSVNERYGVRLDGEFSFNALRTLIVNFR